CYVVSRSPHSFPSRHTSTSPTYTLSLHDALPIAFPYPAFIPAVVQFMTLGIPAIPISNNRYRLGIWRPYGKIDSLFTINLNSVRSEEHTSELQSRFDLVCRLLLEKKNQHYYESTC